MNFDEAVNWLYASQLHGIKLGLENIQRLTAALGVNVGGPNAPKFLHVAGTNGKGSVCALLDACCRAGGLRTGLFTSPHLITFRERIRLDGEMISETEVAGGLTKIRDLTEGWDHAATFFEITTALLNTILPQPRGIFVGDQGQRRGDGDKRDDTDKAANDREEEEHRLAVDGQKIAHSGLG